ncbi:MAG TPA: aldehyde dehydrogenase family protein [Methanoregula sp.]|nr:aldehyde dehydrogenase family protein [Methanoregula sp.]
MQMIIGGKETGSSGGGDFSVRNPATGEVIGTAPAGTVDDVGAAVDAARDAGAGWAAKTVRERGIILFRAAAVVREKHQDLARLLTMEQGKPLREATDEVRGFANILEFYAGISASQYGEAVRLGAAGDCMVVREPLGVCGAIIPWNMPVLIMGWKTGPALLAGNTLVLKPASTTPLTSLKLAGILGDAGLPPGVLNMVTGSGEVVGEAIAGSPGISKLSFTGEAKTGERVRALAAGHAKELVLELGGSDPMIVMDDADIGKAVDGAIRGRFYNAGQTCTAVKRLYVHERIADAFNRALKARIEALSVGNGLGSKIDMGPLNNPAQRDRIAELVEGVRQNDEGIVVTGGCPLKGRAFEGGYFYRPTLVTGAAPGGRLLREEVFGPVLPVTAFQDLGEAIREANATRFGLGASVWTKDIGTVRRVFSEVDAGIIWVNRHLTVPPEVPFGGVKESGSGRENGQQAFESYSRTKTLFLGW